MCAKIKMLIMIYILQKVKSNRAIPLIWSATKSAIYFNIRKEKTT